MSDLKPTSKNIKLLPALEPKIDIMSFESAYSSGTSIGAVSTYNSKLSNSTYIGIGSGTSTIYKDKRVQDAITIFDRDVKENITIPYGDKKGSIVCKIAAGGGRNGDVLWGVLSGLTLMTGNLFGMPIGSCITDIEVEVEIYNLKDNLIAKYSATGSDKAYVAAYWGYEPQQGQRKSAFTAFKMALNTIKLKIQADYDRLTFELK